MIDSGSWLTDRTRQKRRPATIPILRDFEVFARSSRMFENKFILFSLWYAHKLRREKREKNYDKKIMLKDKTEVTYPQSYSHLQGQKMLREGRVRRIHTHIHFISSSFHGRLSPHITFCDPHPTVFCLFLSSFRYNPASRQKRLSSQAALYTSPRTFAWWHPIFPCLLKKCTQIYR